MYPTIHDPATTMTLAAMHQDELIADARSRRRAREVAQLRRAARRKRRQHRLIH
jgi:hypothetical protein